MKGCSWCGATRVRIARGVVEPHKVAEADANLCPGSGKPPHDASTHNDATARREICCLCGTERQVPR